MKTKISYLLATAALAWITLGQSHGATIPAGSALVVRTLQPIPSAAPRGRSFLVQLETNVTVDGKVLLPAGTKGSIKVETSTQSTTSGRPLTVNLTDLQFGGHTVPIKTTGARRLDNFKTAGGVAVSVNSSVVASGKKIEFRLAESLNL